MQSAKQSRPSVVTDEGMQIDESEPQLSKANSPIDDS
jgi:hypothetical protein